MAIPYSEYFRSRLVANHFQGTQTRPLLCKSSLAAEAALAAAAAVALDSSGGTAAEEASASSAADFSPFVPSPAFPELVE